MTATTPALRIALIHGGRIIEDRTLDAGKKSTITVGADPKSTFCVPMGEVPKSVTLFKVTKEGAQLTAASLEGRVSLGGPEQSLADVPANVTLMKGSKGRVKVGDVTVLFQMVTPPAAAPLPELPKGAKGVVAQLDRAFVIAMAFSFLAHLVGAGYVMAQPTPVEPDLSLADWQQQDRFAATLMPIPKQVPEKAPEKTKDPIAEAPKKDVEKSKAPVAETPSKSKTTTTASADAVKARLSKMGMLAIIGSVGGEGGVVGDLLKDSNGVGGVADAMKNAGVHVATADDALKLKLKGSETGTTVGVTAMGTDGVKNVVLEESKTVAIAGRVREEVITVDTPEISTEALSNWMRGRRGAIVSCYERELKRDHSLSGRLVLKFVVSTRGRVTDLDLTEGTMQNAAVRECITSIAKNWVLPFTPEDEVPVAFPFVFSPVN
ncbi:MAG: AgmX/PglI C-terminal domain-containing protein [Archangiaceae bacterium]|nr:AgmX/PglI C-terminal domain-containing protein [Archangiaceae bacterium]